MSDSINPNTEVNLETPSTGAVEIPAGESLTSFDMLEKALETKKAAPEPKEAPSKKEAAPKEEKKEKEQAEKLDAKDSGKGKEDEKDSSKEPAQAEAPSVSKDQLVEVMVDGKKEQVALKDLMNHYSGKVAWDKKFTELDKERKAFVADKQTVEGQISNFFDTASKDPRAAILNLCEMAGIDSVMFMRQLRSGLLPEMQKLAQMSEVERKAFELEEEVNLLRKAKESETSRTKHEQEQKSLMAEVERIQETYKVDAETIKAYYTELKSIVKDPSSISAKTIEEFTQIKQACSQVTSTLEQVRPELATDNTVVEAMANFLLDNPGTTVEDLKDVIEQVYGKRGSTKALKKKVESAAKAEGLPVGSAETKTKPNKNPSSDPVLFEDLE